MKDKQQWTTVIRPKNGWFDIELTELLRYRDLIFLFVKRNFTSQYRQTLLGPAWAVIKPLLNTVVFTVIFGIVAGLPTAGVPAFLFYMAGNIAWQYFSNCLTAVSDTFIANSYILKKVYFPRLVMPISNVLSHLITFAIQFALFVVILIVYAVAGGYHLSLNWTVLLLPLCLLQMAILSLGCGVIVSSLTTRYRDLRMLVGFGVQLWMYATPVVYSSEIIPEKLLWLFNLNPMTPSIELFRTAFFGGEAALEYWGIGWITTAVLLFIGVILFSRVEKTFADTV
ncbi:MAG: ABC transporter permease [Clostridia bacterium]|nr:ABC transporter permease [Clostridia bacterium]MEE1025251.1 ABC transporter permease [Acutalibacteraceae bacterium]